jgi:hypothetical protein
MPPAARLTFLVLYAKELDAPLPANDPDIVEALDAYNAKYSKESSNCLKDQRAETLAGLPWLYLNHADVSRALRRISEPQQLLLATALSLDYETLSSKSQWQAILRRAIAARVTPGDTPTKRKGRAASASSRAAWAASLARL